MKRTKSCVVVAAILLASLLMSVDSSEGKPSAEEERQNTANPRTADEVVPGISLDGSIIIDESVWLSLIGEPGRHMTEAFTHFSKGNALDAAKSIRKAASFLYIASDNAVERQQATVQRAAVALDKLHRRVAKAEINKEELKQAFSRAHLAMSGHHAAKAADSLTKQNWALAGSYLSSSANHLERASSWSESELPQDTKQLLSEARRTGTRLLEDGEESVAKASHLIGMLANRIERFAESQVAPKQDGSDGS